MSDTGQPLSRIGSVVGIRPDKLEEYCRLHAEAWPEVVAANRQAGLTNHSIFLLREKNLLFSYHEYCGQDRAADRAKLAANPMVQEWWRLCRPMQVPIVAANGSRRWAELDLIYHQP